jgi:hypothetical protein
MHIDWQQITALAIVAVAALAVGRRMWGQIAAFRNKPGKASGGGCEGCPSSGVAKNIQAPPLMQIQTRPPVHLRRPPPQ